MTIIVENFSHGYPSEKARLLAIHKMARSGRANYFVPYRDTQSRFALQFGLANWVPAGEVHVDGGYPVFLIGPEKRRKYPRCGRPWAHLSRVLEVRS